MLKKKQKPRKKIEAIIEKEIAERLEELDPIPVYDESYGKAVQNLKTLEEIRNPERKLRSESKNLAVAALITGGLQIIGIVIVRHWEQLAHIGGKAFGMIQRIAFRK